MVGGVLGFNTNTKKSDVGNYFKTVQDTLSSTKRSLNKIVADMKSENHPNSSTVETAVTNLVTTTLDKIIQGAKTASEAIGTTGDELLGNVAAQNNGGTAGAEVDKLAKGIKSIVDVVLKDKGNPDAGDDKKAEDGNTARTNGNAADGEAGKLFVTGNGAAGAQANAKKVVTDAAKAVGAVTGADILKTIIEDKGKAAKLAENNDANANIGVSPKDATIAGGIALRAMAKNGKFSNSNDADVSVAVKGVTISAVTKALGTLTIAIRETIDTGLKTVKDTMKFNSIDTPLTIDNTTSEAKKN
ncbi:variable large family protein (plasmid) [Borrelia parkeri]|nr:variable large family protein [Borrelia parkeri]